MDAWDISIVTADLGEGDDYFLTQLGSDYCECETTRVYTLPDGGPYNLIPFEIYGGSGTDVLEGAWEGDDIYGNGDNDYISGGPGDDHLYGDGGPDIINGGAGDDTISGSDLGCYTTDNSPDWIVGGEGDDTLKGCAGDCDYLSGSGNDTCDGGNGNYDWCTCEYQPSGCEGYYPESCWY